MILNFISKAPFKRQSYKVLHRLNTKLYRCKDGDPRKIRENILKIIIYRKLHKNRDFMMTQIIRVNAGNVPFCISLFCNFMFHFQFHVVIMLFL